jgi:hypothetical protein
MSLVAVPERKVAALPPTVYQYLLLGELRSSLEEESGSDDSQRWLLAVLDRLLASYPRDEPTIPGLPALTDRKRWVQKLQRLRDRVAHRAPFQILANEIRCDLSRMMDLQRSHHGE